jgi:hypothetical protein
MTPKDFTFVETPSETPQQVLMIRNFADLALSGDRHARADYAAAAAAAAAATQHYLDLVWARIASR